MSSEDEFMEIVNNSLDNLDFSSLDLTLKDLHVGLKHLAASMLIITEFINDFLSSLGEETQRKPELGIDAVIYANDMFTAAQKFCEEFYDFDEEDLEDVDDDDDDDDDDDMEDE